MINLMDKYDGQVSNSTKYSVEEQVARFMCFAYDMVKDIIMEDTINEFTYEEALKEYISLLHFTEENINNFNPQEVIEQTTKLTNDLIEEFEHYDDQAVRKLALLIAVSGENGDALTVVTVMAILTAIMEFRKD